MRARRVEYWCYPNHINGENDHTPVAGARMTYGFGFWRSGFLTLIPWIYSSSNGDPRNYLDGSSMDFFNRWEPDGKPVPVAQWEAYREGYDDYRYLYTLEQLIAEAKKSPKPAARAPRPPPSRNGSTSGSPSACNPSTSTTTSGRRPSSTSTAGSWRSRSWR